MELFENKRKNLLTTGKKNVNFQFNTELKETLVNIENPKRRQEIVKCLYYFHIFLITHIFRLLMTRRYRFCYRRRPLVLKYIFL